MIKMEIENELFSDDYFDGGARSIFNTLLIFVGASILFFLICTLSGFIYLIISIFRTL
jgi:hypothetical protein